MLRPQQDQVLKLLATFSQRASDMKMYYKDTDKELKLLKKLIELSEELYYTIKERKN